MRRALLRFASAALAAAVAAHALDPSLTGLLTPAGLPGSSAKPSAPVDGGAVLTAAPTTTQMQSQPATTTTKPQPATTKPSIGAVLAAMPRDDEAALATTTAPAPSKGQAKKAAAPARAPPRRAATTPAPAPAPTLTSPTGQPLCPETPAATYQCVPYGFSPESAPSLKACVDLCTGPPIPGVAPTCVNCGDPAAACKKAHGEYGNTFTYTLVSREKEPCYVPPPVPREGDANCPPNVGENNRGCGNRGSNNRGSFNVGDGNVGDMNKGSFNVGNRNQGNYNRGNCNRGDGNQGQNLSGNFLIGNGNNPCPL